MKSMNLIFRRTHLYLGMFLVPWLFVYAFSTFMVNHGSVFRKMRPPPDAWSPVWEKAYSVDLPQGQAALREWAEELLNEEGISTARFGVNRNAQRALITSQRFLNPIRVTYHFSDNRLVAEKREGSWVEAMLRMHFRTGYGQGDPQQFIWGLIVDVVCIALIVWLITGLYLWWKIPRIRRWGIIALVGGFVYFAALVAAL